MGNLCTIMLMDSRFFGEGGDGDVWRFGLKHAPMGPEVNTLFDNRKRRKTEPLNPGRCRDQGTQGFKSIPGFNQSTSFQFHPLLAQ